MKWLAVGCMGLLLAAFCEIYRELHSFKITHYAVTSAKWAECSTEDTVIFLSDLHEHLYGVHNEELLKAIRVQHPSAIWIGGDMLVGKKKSSSGSKKNRLDYADKNEENDRKMWKNFRNSAELVNNLCKICPVYYANGNHEQRMKEQPDVYGESYRKYREAIENENLTFLENESVELEIGGKKIRLSGLELPMRTYEKFKRSVVNPTDITDRLGECEKENYQVLLAHNPEYVESYLRWGADLILCGHLHGGLICLPNGRSVITPQFHLFPKYAGEMRQEGNQTVIVSRGLGTHTIHVRLFNRAEVIVLHLK